MRLNVQSDYALRLLMHLAVNEDTLCTIADTATRYDISKNHLMKVAHILGREGIIETIRGRSGGLRLKQKSDDIGIGAIVRLMEADLALVECFQGGKNQCLITPACKLKVILNDAMNAFLDVLDQYTIKDLVSRNPELKLLLGEKAA